MGEKGINKREERLGEINMSNEGCKMMIIEYKNKNNIIIEFQDEYKAKIHTDYTTFKRGEVKNPFYPSVYGVGYLGEGKYKASENGKKTKAYEVWRNMLKRCYDPYYINKNLTYIDCYVCNEWLNFQIFAEWWENNVYNCNNERMELDKDILIKRNKIYSPKTCMIVPHRINILFVKSNARRGEYPIGATYDKNNNKLKVYCCILENKSKSIYLGSFPLDKPFQAFTTYKKYKENYIKYVADEYKDLIPLKLYEALYRYEVEIND